MLNDKVVLITGGTGSFGHKFVEIVLQRYKPKKLIIFSRDEMKQYEMSKIFCPRKNKNIRYFIGDVRDAERLHRAFCGVDIVIHAAALKIVPTAEYNPFEAVKTNIIGAENVINIAIDNNVEKVLALSTDKAVNPINLYGATKLCAEKMFIAANNYSAGKTKFDVVRYGNVLGSRGSVVPFFKQCAQETGVIPITDKRMTRFWITLEQGVEFVLGCLNEMRGAEVFVPKMPSMRIVDLARAVCPKCKIKVTGIRPGEKLHESLLTPDDGPNCYEYDDRYVVLSQIAAFHHRTLKKGKLLGFGFKGYHSNTNTQWLSVEALKEILDVSF